MDACARRGVEFACTAERWRMCVHSAAKRAPHTKCIEVVVVACGCGVQLSSLTHCSRRLHVYVRSVGRTRREPSRIVGLRIDVVCCQPATRTCLAYVCVCVQRAHMDSFHKFQMCAPLSSTHTFISDEKLLRRSVRTCVGICECVRWTRRQSAERVNRMEILGSAPIDVCTNASMQL